MVLLELYSRGHKLPEMEITHDVQFNNELSTDEKRSIQAKINDCVGSNSLYSVVFDPFVLEDNQMTIGALTDDFSDIYFDIKNALIIFQKGTEQAIEHSLWELKFGFTAHWGNHAIDALRTLHYLVHDHLGKE